MIHSLHRPRRTLLTPVVLAFIGLLVVLAAACGSESTGSVGPSAQVSQSGAIYTVDDLMALGFKKSRTYSLDGLPGATEAIFGFWRVPNGDPVDFEVRFYGSHDDAVSLGKALGEEGSGEDAVLDDSEATYQHGAKDRRIIIGHGAGGGGRSGIGPKYADYAIFDNLVMLCQGGTSGQSLERCGFLADALRDARVQ